MRELQKYYAAHEDAHEDTGECENQCTAIYLASEADAAFAEMRRENEGLRKQVSDFMAIERQMISDSEAAKLEYKRDADMLIAKHAEEVERLTVKQAAIAGKELFLSTGHYPECGVGEGIFYGKCDCSQRHEDESIDIDHLRKQAERYEKLRKLNVYQFRNLYVSNISGEGRFDDLVDQLPASGQS